MAFSFNELPSLSDPLTGFRFGVFFLGSLGVAHPLDFRFQEVSGLDVRLEVEAADSLGQGDRARQLPGRAVYQNLVLKRGMPGFSTLRSEIQSSLLSSRQTARNILLSVLDENALPLNSWLFSEAFPVHWSISTLDANSSQVIIETMELTYSNFRPFSL